MRDGPPYNCILLVVHSDKDMGCVLEVFDWGVRWDSSIPNEEDEVQEGPDLDCLAVTGILVVFTRPEVVVESQLEQVRKMTGFGVGGGGCCNHNGLENADGDDLFLFEQRVLDVVGFKLTGEASVQSSVGLGVCSLFRVREAVQKVGRRNRPPFLRN